MKALKHTVFVAAALAMGLACSVPPAEPPRTALPGAPSPLHRSLTVAGQSREGRPIEVEVLGNGPDVVMVIATIHGNEAAGTPLIGRLSRHLQGHPELLRGRTAVLVPVANPDGMARRTRTNTGGVDLNRNFPTGNYRAARRHGPAPLSEPESRAIHDLIVKHAPARVVSIHQPIGVVDWDGPGRELASIMAASCDMPAKRLGARPGSLGSWVGLTLGRPIVTLEMPEGRGDQERDWKRFGPALLLAIAGGTPAAKAR